MELTPELEEELEKNLSDKFWRLNNLYWIKDKNGKEIEFKLNPAQLYFYQNKHNKNVILKARQQGFTTFQCISYLDDCLFTANLSAGIIAHNVEDAEDFFENKIKFAYEKLQKLYPDITDIITADTNSAGKLKFSNGSSIRVRTSFRSGTLQRLHVSEYAKIAAEFPKKAKEIRTGAFNAVSADQEITVESTAEGMSGEYYNLCEKAQAVHMDELTSLDFKFFFFPWWKSKEYRLNPEGIKIPVKLEVYFTMLKAEHRITLDAHQKAWYFKKSQEQGEEMPQEYPSFAEEAFITSGRPVFDRERVAADIKRAKDISFITGRFDTNGAFIEDKHGPYKIFKKPAENRKYAIGADIAEGLEDGDSSTQSILNKSYEQVAVYHGHIHPDLFGSEMIHAGKFFNEALLAPEVNNHGLTTLTHITNKNYPFVYERTVLDERTNQFIKKVGWQTNMKTKPMMLDELIAAYNGHGDYAECPLKIYDLATLREMLSLKYEPDGGVNLNGKDRVVAAAISVQAIKQVSEVEMGAFDTVAHRQKSPKTLEDWLRAGEGKEESYFD